MSEEADHHICGLRPCRASSYLRLLPSRQTPNACLVGCPATCALSSRPELRVTICKPLQTCVRSRLGRRRAGTREALAEQLRLGQELRRRVERPASGSDASTSASDASGDEGGEGEAGGGGGSGEGAAAKRGRGAGARAKAAALDLLHGAHRVWPPLCRVLGWEVCCSAAPACLRALGGPHKHTLFRQRTCVIAVLIRNQHTSAPCGSLLL
jgi:hypothetical protein